MNDASMLTGSVGSGSADYQEKSSAMQLNVASIPVSSARL